MQYFNANDLGDERDVFSLCGMWVILSNQCVNQNDLIHAEWGESHYRVLSVV